MAHITRQTLAKAKKGDEPALAAILAHTMPMVRRAAAMGVCPGLEFDDALQEGIIGLFNAIRTYDVEKGITFDTYASACVQNAVLSARRKAGRNKHNPLNNSVPLTEEQTSSLPGPEELAIRQEDYAHTVQAIENKLSLLEQDVLGLFLQGLTYTQIAERLGRTPKTVENALFRLRRKLRDADIHA